MSIRSVKESDRYSFQFLAVLKCLTVQKLKDVKFTIKYSCGISSNMKHSKQELFRFSFLTVYQ